MGSIFFYLTIALFIFVCVILILLVLIQKGRGGGLASAFGGAGGNTAFGSKTGDVLTWATSIVFGIFLLVAVALNLMANARNRPATAGTTALPTPADTGSESPVGDLPAGDLPALPAPLPAEPSAP